MKVVLMNVAQADVTANREALACVGTAVCVDKADKVIETMLNREEINKKPLLHAVKSGHWSVLEHLPITWLVEDVSRSLTHQLVRHRIASYSQMSQRFVAVDKCMAKTPNMAVIPPTVLANQKAVDLYMDCVCDAIFAYQQLIDKFNIPKEDARYLLPNAMTTKILVSMNARAFIEAATKRRCNRAQWEIRELFDRMRECIKPYYPTVYELAVPNCQKGKCTEVKPCGHPRKD